MNTLIAAAIRCCLLFLVPTVTYTISTQWDLDPISGDWNTAANWTPNGVPNGPTDIATFGLSNTTDVSISANTEVNSIIFTPAATNPYTILVDGTASPGLTLTISGTGITNNSGITQNFVITGDAFKNVGTIVFSHHATAGSNVSIYNEGGTMNFSNHSSAAGASILNESDGLTNFSNHSSAAGASILNDGGGLTNFSNHSGAAGASILNEFGGLTFFDHSTAGSASIDNEFDSGTLFFNNSTAANSTITLYADCGLGFLDNSTAANSTIQASFSNVQFLDNSTAGSASIGVAGVADESLLQFFDNSTAGSASIGVSDGSTILFGGSSRGGTAAIGLFHFDSNLDISGHDAPGVTIGSLEGDEMSNVFLGGNNLTVGSNNLSTTFAGVIDDGGSGGSLTKIGTGTFILSGANTYTGDTNINGGVLQVDGSITSNTFVNQRGTLAGIGTINGNAVNNSRVSPGSIGAPGTLTVTGTYTQTQFATLMIQIAGANAGGAGGFGVLNVLGNANLNGFLDPTLLNGFVPTLGQTFTFLNYASLTGEFSHIKHRVFDNGLQWSVIYDANHAILTVEQAPDQGSTFLLLTLGLLGLVAYRRQLLRGQP